MAVGQNKWYHFEVGAPPILVYLSGDWDVHWGYGILTHGPGPVLVFEEGYPIMVVLKGHQEETRQLGGPNS